jgi:hypothetical protein
VGIGAGITRQVQSRVRGTGCVGSASSFERALCGASRHVCPLAEDQLGDPPRGSLFAFRRRGRLREEDQPAGPLLLVELVPVNDGRRVIASAARRRARFRRSGGRPGADAQYQ